MPWYRCTLINEDEYVEIIMDVLTDENNVIDAGLTFFGSWRDHDAKSGTEPFSLDYSGKMVWGHPYVSIFPIRGSRVFEGATISYKGYPTNAAYERGETDYETVFTIKAYRSYG